MNKIASDKIVNHFYNLGVQSAMSKTATSVKDVAKMLGRGSAYTLPTVGTVGGIGAGTNLGYELGHLVAGDPLRSTLMGVQSATRGQQIKPLLEALSDAPMALALAGMGVGAGASLGAVGGGILGNKGGNLLKEKLLRRLAP